MSVQGLLGGERPRREPVEPMRSPHHNQALDQGLFFSLRKAECWGAASRATRMEDGTCYRRPTPFPEAGGPFSR